MTIRPSFDPNAVGSYERQGWEAYYDRDWARVLRLMVALNRAQFGLSWPLAVTAALDTVRASRAFAPAENDLAAARRHLTRFYAKARRGIGMRAEPAALAALELDYWVVHRELATRRQANRQDTDLTPLVDALAALHAALFDTTPQDMRVAAGLRALAAATVDRITGGSSEDVPADWRAVERLLQQCYRSVIVTAKGRATYLPALEAGA